MGIMNFQDSGIIQEDTDLDADFPGQDDFWALAENADVISFDFFDTLFFRPLADPEDAFEIIALKHNIPKFPELRKKAQTEAFNQMHLNGHKEITFDDIYRCIAAMGLPADALKQSEYHLELALTEPNPELFHIFKRLLMGGKHVIIISDMYFPKGFFEEALKRQGISDVPIYVSSDCNATKRDSGELYAHVSAEVTTPVSRILHIGDNLHSDVKRAREKGLMTFHYRSGRQLPSTGRGALSSSIGMGLLRTHAREIDPLSYTGLGFLYGGPANLGFLKWIEQRAKKDQIDHLLFLSRDGYVLERIANKQRTYDLPSFHYLLGSRTAFTLASISNDNFVESIPFLLSGADGMVPSELLERIGVAIPANKVMIDLGLGPDERVGPELYDRLARFLYAYRWEILKVCRRNRRALFLYLKQLGIEDGSRVAIVDVGWSGSTQAAFEKAIQSFLGLKVYGYYFCLANTTEVQNRKEQHHMHAMYDETNTPFEKLSALYEHRVLIEHFFSAPHDTIIGLEIVDGQIFPVTDSGRGVTGGLNDIAKEVCSGVEYFADLCAEFEAKLGFVNPPHHLARTLLDLVSSREMSKLAPLFESIKNFDAWGSSRNHELCLLDYICQNK